MNKRFFSLLAAFALCLTLIPTTAFADDEKRGEDVSPCSCETACTADNMNKECPVCGAENAIPQNCGQYIPVEDRTGENGSTERADDPNGPIELSATDQVQAMIDGLPNAEEITEDNAEEVKAQLEAIDEAKEKLSDEEIDELDMTRYAEAAAALGALAAPMLLANNSPDEQFSLKPGDTYYFDLSAMGIPGTVNDALPDNTLHYVPFTYAGTVDAYKLTTAMATTEEYAQQNKYAHSLFVADYVVTHTVGWDNLDDASLIFGKNYATGGISYTLRAPSTGSDGTGSGNSRRGTPQSNEWDRILDKDDGYIKNCGEVHSWGQDTDSSLLVNRARRGYNSARNWSDWNATWSRSGIGFRPVLEVLNPKTLGADGLKAITLDLGGGKLGNSSEAIQIIVKNGESFTAPASDGLIRPDGDTGSYFMWLGSDSKLYASGSSVPADVTKLTAQFAPGIFDVTITTDRLPDGKVGEAYSQTLTADGTEPVAWSISSGNLPDGLKLDGNTGEISGTPTAEGTAKFTVKAENSAGSDTKELSITITKAAPAEHTVTVTSGGNGTASASPAKAAAGTEITLTATPNEGYHFKEWQVESPAGLVITNNKFTMPDSNVEIKAIFEEDAPPLPTDPAKPSISVAGTYTYNGSEHTATVSGYDPATMDISGNTATDAGDYTVRVTSKTGKWADGSTEAVTAAWSIGKATQEAPNGLIGVAPTTKGGSDGKITGVTDKMEYRMAGERSYTACSGTEIDNLSAGNYFVRYAEDPNHFASSDAEVTVGEGASLADCTITFNAGGGSGSMASVTVKAETNYILPACGFTAPADQEFKAWEIGGIEYNAGDGYVVLGNTEIKALWKDSAVIPTTFTITFNANGGTGSMEPVTVEEGSRYPLPACGFIPPVNMQFSGWALSAGGSVIADGAIMVTSNITLYAIWEPVPVNEFVVFFDGNGGTPAVSSMMTIGHRLAFLPGAFRSGSYCFDGWYTERNGGELITTSTVFAANTIVYAHWTYTGGSGGSGGYVPGYYIIRATAGAGGFITPSGDVSVRAGANQTFTITPNRGYAVSDVKIDGRSIGAVRSYTFENISASHTIEVQFRVRSSFVDVPSGSYYEDAVDWAVANGITTGTDAAHFSPDGICTRAQAVTFLWRAAGSPKPETRTMPFTDVPAGSYYYDAVLWAVENDITKGTSDTTFSPNMTCTRAQIVAFLWRSEKSPAAGTANPFADVKSAAYYADAVLWAAKKDITKGTTNTTFSPDADCTRAQIVTFLWRCKK